MTAPETRLFAVKYGPRELVRKIVATRRNMNRHGHTRKNLVGISNAMRAVAPWVDAYPNATNESALRFIGRNYIHLLKLTPGGDHPAGPVFRKHLEYYALGLVLTL